VFFVDHAAHALWVVLEGSEANYISVCVDGRDRQIGGLNQLEHLRVGVHSVVDVVLSDLDQVDDGVGVVGIGSSENDIINVELLFFFRLLLVFKFLLIFSIHSWWVLYFVRICLVT